MEKIIFATGNAGKMKEIRAILEGFSIKGEETQILSMKEAGIDIAIREDGATFMENAVIKAKATAQAAQLGGGKAIVMADDSGLEIDCLNKEPGIYSARYLGEETPYSEKNRNLIERMENVPEEKRTARFVCAIACVLPDGEVLREEAAVEGKIGYEERGKNGFGYDPIFMLQAYGKSTAELTEEEKNEISHRGKALRAMRRRLDEMFGANGEKSV